MKFSGIALAVIALTCSAPATSSAQAARPGMPTADARSSSEESSHDRCDANALRGTYVFSASGFNIVAGVAQPKAIVEVVEFNGDGTLSVPTATVSINGVILHSPPGIGTYTVADDCSGTIQFAGPSFDIVVSQDREVIWMIQTNAASVFQGTATRSSRDRGRR